MSIHCTARGAIASLVLVLVGARVALTQRCVGGPSLVLNDTAGQMMTPEQLPLVTIQSINGVPLRIRHGDGPALPRFEYDVVTRYGAGDSVVTESLNPITNPWTLDGTYLLRCGQVGDITLHYAGRIMRLVFDLPWTSSVYRIESPRFRDGTFHLRSLTCESNALPPRVGACRVRADNWDGIDKEWARHLIPSNDRDLASGFVYLSADECRKRGVVVLTTRSELDAEWKSHPEIAKPGAYGPLFDFRWEIALAIYRLERNRRSRLSRFASTNTAT